MSWKSDFPELNGVEYATKAEALSAESAILTRKKNAESAKRREQGAADMARIAGEEQAIQGGDQSEDRVSQTLSALPPPPLREDGKQQARGFALSQEDQDAILGRDKIMSDPARLPTEQQLALARVKRPETKEFFEGLESLSGLRKTDADIAKQKTDIEHRDNADDDKALLDAERRKMERERLELQKRDLERKIRLLDEKATPQGEKSLGEKYGY